MAALAASTTFVLLAEPLVRANLLDCGSGLGDLGCALLGGLLGALLAVGAASVVGGGLLWAMGVPKGPLVGVFSGFGVVSSWFAWRAVVDTRPAAWAVLAVVFFVWALAFHGLFNRAPVPLAVAVPYAVVALVGGFFGFHVVGNAVESWRYERQVRAWERALDFEVYEPTRLPPGYRRHDRGVHGQYTEDPDYYELSYLHPDQPPLYVRSFKVTPAYDPPRECGYERPVEWPFPVPCVPVGPAFRADFPSSGTSAWYTRRGDTEVVVTGGPSEAAVVEVMGSLRVRALPSGRR